MATTSLPPRYSLPALHPILTSLLASCILLECGINDSNHSRKATKEKEAHLTASETIWHPSPSFLVSFSSSVLRLLTRKREEPYFRLPKIAITVKCNWFRSEKGHLKVL